MSGYVLKNSLAEQRIFLSRIIAAFVLIVVLSVGLLVRLVYLQVVGHTHYATLAKENSIKIAPLAPTRGIIYDRNGKILADNIPSYTLELVPEQVPNMDETLRNLKNLLDIPEEKIEQFREHLPRNKRFATIPLLLRLSEAQVAAFSVVRPYFPGVDIHAGLVRYYPYGELVSHVVGYVGRINEQELKTLPEANYQGSYHVGKSGIESAYEVDLHGTTGYVENETNAQSRPINIVNEFDPVPGINLHLTLDIDLQKTAYDALEGYNGAAVAIAIKTGEVLVFASRPGFDPNPFVYGIGSKAYKDLQESEDQPLFNRVLRGQYPPGSTMKPFVALAGLENEAISFQHRVFCPGAYQLPNSPHKFRDWKKGGHGSVSMENAIIESCDVYFYSLAQTLGIDRLHDFLQKFGFGEETGIDLKGEKPGLLPSREWKRKTQNQEWYPGETVITGIGQGFTQVTPMQLARATATLANRGRVVQPFLVNRALSPGLVAPATFPREPLIPLKDANVTNIINAMVNVIHSARGTAKALGLGLPYKMAAKTGTAQVFTVKQKEKYNEDQIKFKLRDHALFIAFAPADNPRLAVAVIAENGGHGGSVAGPIAKKIINQYLGIK
ncbi:MAG: penicillin-binding protein 2 [Methylococcaceae bacterium]|nr:penicillin-binding protein 2 [Methylococcaceae bacterium]